MEAIAVEDSEVSGEDEVEEALEIRVILGEDLKEGRKNLLQLYKKSDSLLFNFILFSPK